MKFQELHTPFSLTSEVLLRLARSCCSPHRTRFTCDQRRLRFLLREDKLRGENSRDVVVRLPLQSDLVDVDEHHHDRDQTDERHQHRRAQSCVDVWDEAPGEGKDNIHSHVPVDQPVHVVYRPPEAAEQDDHQDDDDQSREAPAQQEVEQVAALRVLVVHHQHLPEVHRLENEFEKNKVVHRTGKVKYSYQEVTRLQRRQQNSDRPPPKERHPILQTCYITMQQAMQAEAQHNINNADEYASLLTSHTHKDVVSGRDGTGGELMPELPGTVPEWGSCEEAYGNEDHAVGCVFMAAMAWSDSLASGCRPHVVRVHIVPPVEDTKHLAQAETDTAAAAFHHNGAPFKERLQFPSSTSGENKFGDQTESLWAARREASCSYKNTAAGRSRISPQTYGPYRRLSESAAPRLMKRSGYRGAPPLLFAVLFLEIEESSWKCYKGLQLLEKINQTGGRLSD
ncbi:hypothetical protein EYF80_040899 [Liparis tanakae]|uniref:Uncharacterized protein n=1 Tax=Liparis tanakae TaxID=230148 RepID=A0A4Z2G5M0_9TELE|nr:hypothetical protein EYF80_040899 [Liparis tanakae]